MDLKQSNKNQQTNQFYLLTQLRVMKQSVQSSNHFLPTHGSWESWQYIRRILSWLKWWYSLTQRTGPLAVIVPILHAFLVSKLTATTSLNHTPITSFPLQKIEEACPFNRILIRWAALKKHAMPQVPHLPVSFLFHPIIPWICARKRRKYIYLWSRLTLYK